MTRTYLLPLTRATAPLALSVIRSAATAASSSTAASGLALRVTLAPDAPPVDVAAFRELRAQFPRLLPERSDFTADLSRDGDALRAVDGCDGVLLAGGDLTTELTLLRAAQQLQVRRVVKVSGAAGLVRESSALEAGRVHWRVEQHLRDASTTFDDGVAIVRPTMGMDAFLHGCWREMVCGRTLSMSVKTGRVAFVHPTDVADVVVRLTRDDSRSLGSDVKELEITGPEALSFEQVAHTFSQQLGQSVRYSYFPLWAMQPALWIKGVRPDDVVSEIALAKALEAGAEAQVTNTVSDVLGRPPRSFDAFVQENQSQWPLQSYK